MREPLYLGVFEWHSARENLAGDAANDLLLGEDAEDEGLDGELMPDSEEAVEIIEAEAA